MATLATNVQRLRDLLARIEPRRYSTPLANDVYEAAWYWRDLGQWVLEKNTKVDYPARASEEQLLLNQLRKMSGEELLEKKEEYDSIFEIANEILRAVAETLPLKEGHMGILRFIRTNFAFLETEYGFVVVDQQPLGMKYSSGCVWIDFEHAGRTNQCCTFGPEPRNGGIFWPEDLLFALGDPRYREIQEERLLENTHEVETWFKVLAEIWRNSGRDVLSCRPGVFDRLTTAQKQRAAELTAATDVQYGDRQ